MGSVSPSYIWSDGWTGLNNTVAVVAPSTTYTFTVTNHSTNGSPCSVSASVDLVVDLSSNKCIPFSNIINPTLFYNTTLHPITIPAGDYQINSDITVHGVVHIASGCNFKIMPNKRITIETDAALIFDDGGDLFSCGDGLWEGIKLIPGARLEIYSSNYNFTLRESKIGVEAYGNNSTIIINGPRNTFRNNHIGLYLHDGTFTSNFNITGLKFDSPGILESPYGTNTQNYHSFMHIKLVNAGTISLGNYGVGTFAGYANEFYDAQYCINARNTSLNIDYCKFDQTNNPAVNRIGVYQIAFNWSGSSNIGWYHQFNPNYNSNKFINCPISISLHGGLDSKVFGNDIQGGQIGVRQFGTNSHDIQIVGNAISFASVNGIELGNCFNSRALVNGNSITSGINTFLPNTEAERGIFVYMTTSHSSDLTIQGNEIENCRIGVQLRNHISGIVTSNNIKYNTTDDNLIDDNFSSKAYFRRGILLQSCQRVSVIGQNTIYRNSSLCQGLDAAKTRLIGIATTFGDNFIQDNVTLNLPTGLRITGLCTGTQLACNIMDACYEGIRLVNPVLDAQGAVGQPNGNKWLNWGPTNDHIKDASAIIFVQVPFNWYYDGTLASSATMTVYPINIPAYILTYATTGSSGCLNEDCPGCIIERVHSIINHSTDSTISEEYRYFNKQIAYSVLKDSLQLMYSGSVYDIELQNFFSLMSLSNIGQIANVEELLRNNDLASAYLLNESVVPSNLIEENSRGVNKIVSTQNRDSIYLSNDQKLILIPIAYQSPLIGGEAVFRARTLLGIDMEESQAAERIKSPNSNLSSRFNIAPNPNRGEFNLTYYLQEGESAEVTITDAEGRFIGYKLLNSVISSAQFNLTDKQNGIYFLNVKNNTGESVKHKVVLLK